MTTTKQAPAKTPAIPIQINTAVRTRVRCAEDHTDPWLRRLYVVWSALPVEKKKAPEPGKAEPAKDEAKEKEEPKPEFEPQVFAVGLSDAMGYLMEVWTEDGSKKPGKSLPLYPGVKYDMYFVRYPTEKFAQELAAELNANFADAVKKWGSPNRVAIERSETAVKKGNAKIEEGFIKIEELPRNYLPKGSDFYKGWLLFRDMPGTGKNDAAADIQCSCLQDEVRRLQYHMGRLRYIVGTHYHPYSPEPAENLHREDDSGRFPNEGVFDICLWNAVLRFQRDARAGAAVALNKSKPRTATLAKGSFDPLPAALDPKEQIRDSLLYLELGEMGEEDAKLKTAAIEEDVDTIVDKATGDAIKVWLEKEWRKPGKILVAKPNWVDWKAWVHEDAYSTVLDLEAILREYKAVMLPGGLLINNGFRDTRMSVVKAGPGQVIYSLHKSGFALDMINEAFVRPFPQQPLHFEKAPAQADGAVRWVVWAEVPADSVQAEDQPKYIEFKDALTPWIYDSGSPDGGRIGPELKIAGRAFLNFTKICNQLGLDNISAHSTGWQLVENKVFELNDVDTFGEFVGALVAAVGASSNAPTSAVTIDGTWHPLAKLKRFSQEMQLWLKATKTHGATPTVLVQPWTKEGQKLVETLRAESMRGMLLNTVVQGYWTGGAGSRGFPEPTAPDQTPADPNGKCEIPPGPVEGVIELIGKKTEFPTRDAFLLTPDTAPAIHQGSTISLPVLGHPAHMEWWHFQWAPGFKGKRWLDILAEIGWTEEGLLGKDGNMPIQGLYGMGYMPGTKGVHKKAT